MMKKETFEKLVDFIKQEEKKYDFNDDVLNYVDKDELKNIDNEEELRETFEKANEDYELTNEEIIYYSNAIEYLQKNDPSLRESMEIAYEFGYETNKIHSELLASLLASRNNEEDYQVFIDDICDEFLSLTEEDNA